MTTIDAIYTRHERALMTVGHASDIVRFSLRLALEELAATQSGDDATIAELGSANLRIMELAADLERLQTATNAEVAELRQQIAQMDADNAALIRRNKELAEELKKTRLDYLEAGFYDERTAPANGNGARAVPMSIAIPMLPDDVPFFQQPQSLDLLDDEAKDWWIGCAAGRHTWRTVPKPVQLRMVRHILSFGPESGAMKMTEFDAIKPDWMPTATSHTKTLNLSWQQLNDWRVEL